MHIINTMNLIKLFYSTINKKLLFALLFLNSLIHIIYHFENFNYKTFEILQFCFSEEITIIYLFSALIYFSIFLEPYLSSSLIFNLFAFGLDRMKLFKLLIIHSLMLFFVFIILKFLIVLFYFSIFPELTKAFDFYLAFLNLFTSGLVMYFNFILLTSISFYINSTIKAIATIYLSQLLLSIIEKMTSTSILKYLPLYFKKQQFINIDLYSIISFMIFSLAITFILKKIIMTKILS